MAGELKKGKYLYYHCTGNRGKCPERYTAQEKLTGEFASLLQELVIPQPVLDWLGDALLESDRTEHAARWQTIDRLRARYEQLDARIETMYTDKLDSRITQKNSSTGVRPTAGESKRQSAPKSGISNLRRPLPLIKPST